MKKSYITHFAFLSLAVLLVFGIFNLTEYIRHDEASLVLVQQYGLGGMLAAAIISGFNIFVPIPAAALAPIFLEAGFSWLTIILVLTFGTTVADSIAYSLGVLGRKATVEKPPNLIVAIENLIARKPALVIPVIFLYASFVPFPNEVLLIPLGLAGYHFRLLIGPLILGSIVNQTLLSFGFNSVFELLF